MTAYTDASHHLSVRRMTKGSLPDLPFSDIKKEILGTHYELSLLFPDDTTSRELHQTWKGLDSPVNVLSFPLDDKSGEIILTLGQARKEAGKFQRTYHQHVACLFIHACSHLAGYDHGHAMDTFEKKIRKKFDLPTD
mgnify:CR=1 FL=1